MQQMVDKRESSMYPENPPSFFVALGQLPRQYFKVVTRPGVQTVREEVRWARWSTVLGQFLALVGITIVLNVLGHHIAHAALHTVATSSIGPFHLFGWLPAPWNGIVFLLATFLIGLGTAYPLSRLSRGQGKLVEHTFILLLVTLPLVTISGALLLIPATGFLVTALTTLVGSLFLYRMVLHAFTIMAVHRLPVGSSILIVLIIPMVLVIIGLLVLAVFADIKFLDGAFSEGSFEKLGEFFPDSRRKKRTGRRA